MNPSVDDLYRTYQNLKAQYEALIRPDPAMLRETDQAQALRRDRDAAWAAWYIARYGSAPAQPADAATLARFEALTMREQVAVARLLLRTGCTIAQAIAAVEATRRQLATQ